MLVLLTALVILSSVSVLYITYVPRMAPGVVFEVCNEASIYRAIMEAQDKVSSSLNGRHGESMLYLSVLAIFNSLVAIFFIFRYFSAKQNT